MSCRSQIAALQKAVTQQDWVEALRLALAWWQTTRSPRLAALVRGVAPRTASSFRPPKARTSAAFHQAWLDIAARDPSPLATGWLAATLTQRLPDIRIAVATHDPRHAFARFQPLRTRLESLGKRPGDPRVADAAVEIVRAGRFGGWNEPASRALYGDVLTLISTLGDVSVVADLWAVAKTPLARRATTRRVLADLIPATVAALERITPEDPEPAALEGLTAGLGSPEPSAASQELQALLDHVLAHPHDDEARAVLADAWMEAGGPRGEHVTLERAGALTHHKQLNRLVRRHGAEWIGSELAAVLANICFKGGLLHTATLQPTGFAARSVWRAATHAQPLSTVRHLWQGQASRDRYERFVTSPQLRDLRRVEIRSEGLLDRLGTGPPRPFEALHFRFLPSVQDLRTIGTYPTFGGVTEIAVPRSVDPEILLHTVGQGGWTSRLRGLIFDDVIYDDPYLTSHQRPLITRIAWLIQNLPTLTRVAMLSSYVPDLKFEKLEQGWVLILEHTQESREDLIVRDHAMYTLDPARASTTRLMPLPELVVAVHLRGIWDAALPGELANLWGVPVEVVG